MARFRKLYKFWLDLDKEVEYELAEQIDLLKSNRQFTPTVRDGIRLLINLRAGNTEILLEMFPDIKKDLQIETLESLLSNMPPNGNHSTNGKPNSKMSPVKFDKSETVELQTTEEYLADVFQDLDDIGF